jgi:SpoVK/Ycf46/Vps4 family AAA+-type ATPase
VDASESLIGSLSRAVEAMPGDIALRLHLAQAQLEAGRRDDAIVSISVALTQEPSNAQAAQLMRRAMSPEPQAADADRAAPAPPDRARPAGEFDWARAEEDLGIAVESPFVHGEGTPAEGIYSSERPTMTLADVGGMAQVKARLEAAFLAPLRNPELRELYGKSLRGGLLMYGPPGCGKTFIGKALAGELGASFLSVGVADVLQEYIGNSERNMHAVFQQARRDAPCVVFLDELDTLGQRRTSNSGAFTGVVNQLLTEMDGVGEDNDGVFILGATNQPWALDPALRRPGRFDRTLLVLPPDVEAREAIFRSNLVDRPVAGIDVGRLAARSDALTGADIAYVCEAAAERALMDSVRTGKPRFIGMADLDAALGEVRPSIGPWLETARTMVVYGDDDGTFRELKAYLKTVKRL